MSYCKFAKISIGIRELWYVFTNGFSCTVSFRHFCECIYYCNATVTNVRYFTACNW